MILIDLPNTTVFRAHTPKYSFQPTSGAGAAKQGGRFNQKMWMHFICPSNRILLLRNISKLHHFYRLVFCAHILSN